MVDYSQAWRVCKIQLIIINAIFITLGIYVGFSVKNIPTGIAIWIFGSWVIGTVVSTFSKSGDRISTLGRSILDASFSTHVMTNSDGYGFFASIVFFWSFIKIIFSLFILSFVLIFEFIIYPITTIVYFVKSRA